MLSHLLTPANIKADLESAEKDEVFEEMIEMIVASQPSVDRQDALNALMQREAQQTTGIIPGIAVPHAQCASVHGTALALGLSRTGVEYDSLDGSPVNFIIMMLFAEGDTVITGAGELRVKETDRLHAIATEFQKFAPGSIEEREDGLIIHGKPEMQRAKASSYGDHRMAMSLAVLGAAAKGVIIEEPDSVNISYPTFFSEIEQL